MPKLRAKEEDEEYNRPEPKMYRKYLESTKIKFVNMVKKQGIKPKSAAKLLKIKGSTAKEILKNFKHPSLGSDSKKEALKPRDEIYLIPETEKAKEEEKATNEPSPQANVVVFFFVVDPETNQYI